jgi:hypothetical protein
MSISEIIGIGNTLSNLPGCIIGITGGVPAKVMRGVK